MKNAPINWGGRAVSPLTAEDIFPGGGQGTGRPASSRHPVRKSLCTSIVNFRNITSKTKNPSIKKQPGSTVTTYSLATCAVSAHRQAVRFSLNVCRASCCLPIVCEKIQPNITEYSDFGPPGGYTSFYPLFEPKTHLKPLSLLHFRELTTQNSHLKIAAF